MDFASIVTQNERDHLRGATIGYLGVVSTFGLAPPSGRVALGWSVPGLKPWAEFCSPLWGMPFGP
jgi:hypothetical protein